MVARVASPRLDLRPPDTGRALSNCNAHVVLPYDCCSIYSRRLARCCGSFSVVRGHTRRASLGHACPTGAREHARVMPRALNCVRGCSLPLPELQGGQSPSIIVSQFVEIKRPNFKSNKTLRLSVCGLPFSCEDCSFVFEGPLAGFKGGRSVQVLASITTSGNKSLSVRKAGSSVSVEEFEALANQIRNPREKLRKT